MGLDIVVWWDRKESERKVFDDAYPHRLAPLCEGRINQCVYHGWCLMAPATANSFLRHPPDDGLPVKINFAPAIVIIMAYIQNHIYEHECV